MNKQDRPQNGGEKPAPPFDPTTPTGAAADSVRRVSKSVKIKDNLTVARFAANVFSRFATAGEHIGGFVGSTAAPTEQWLRGWTAAFETAEHLMACLAEEQPIYLEEELVGEVASVVNPVVASLLKVALRNSQHRMETPAVADVLGENDRK